MIVTRRILCRLPLACLMLSCLPLVALSLRFHLQPNTKRCLKEEMRKDVLVTGEYSLSDSPGVRTDLLVSLASGAGPRLVLIPFLSGIQITDTKGHTALNRENIDKGKFAVNSDEDDIFDFCFVSYLQTGHSMPQPREVFLDMKHGIETKNYEQVRERTGWCLFLLTIDGLVFSLLPCPS